MVNWPDWEMDTQTANDHEVAPLMYIQWALFSMSARNLIGFGQSAAFNR